MNFVDKLSAAGFPSKRQFALYVKYTPQAVSDWKEKPPHWVHIILDQCIGEQRDEETRRAWRKEREELNRIIAFIREWKG